MAKKRPQTKAKRPPISAGARAAGANGDVPVVGAREPCPCGSGRRYKACHGRTAAHAVTELVLEHVAHVPEEFWSQYGPGAVGVGWDLGLHGLAIHIGTRRAVLPSEGMEWMGSPGGKEFIRVSSAGWGNASIAGGTDRDAALAAMGRTTAFYTGENPAG